MLRESSLRNNLPSRSVLLLNKPLLPTTETSGDFEEMSLAAGESAGLVRQIKPAAEIVHEIMSEARRIIEERLAYVGGL
jgi:hypothetical protein